MQTVTIQCRDFVDETTPVVDCAARIGAEVSRLMRSGAKVVVSVKGLRGVSSSFFDVILSDVSKSLGGDRVGERFDVETDTLTQRMIYKRSFDAFFSGPV